MQYLDQEKGFSLVELIVIMVIVGLLSAIVALNFNEWTRKAQIEKTTRELYSDLNSVRTESIFRKQLHSLIIDSNATGYVLKRYSSINESKSSGGTVYMTKPGTYVLSKEGGSSAVGRIFQFDTRGFTADLDTIRINPINSGAVFDCVVVSSTRTNLGKMEGGACVQK